MRAFLVVIGFASLLWSATAHAQTGNLDEPTKSLRAENKADKSNDEGVEALLKDGELIYSEGAGLVGRRPTTKAESEALVEGNFLIKENKFQRALVQASNDHEAPGKAQQVLLRLTQFDNFIFDAVAEVIDCANTEASFRLNISRELLDHAWMEWKGQIGERDWDPQLNWPQIHESCSP